MVIKYSPQELNAIGEMVLIRECISRMPEYQNEPQYHQVFFPAYKAKTTIAAAQSTTTSMSTPISADNFLQDFAQFQQNLDQAIQLNRDISWQRQQQQSQQQSQHSQMLHQQHKQSDQLTASVAEFFRKATQNFSPQPSGMTLNPTSKVRRLSDVEAELLGQLKGEINI